jgi:hypothetical protein
VTPNHDEGYLDGLHGRTGPHGRTNRECSPNYCEGWEAGWRERMLTWGRVPQPAPDLTHDAEGRN